MDGAHCSRFFPDMEIVAEPEPGPLRELAAYWGKKRGDRIAPRRSDIDPTEIPTHLQNIHILDVLKGGADFRYRLVGTAIVEGLGREQVCHRDLRQRPEVLRRIIARFALVVRERCPSYARGRIWWVPNRSFRGFAAASFPLSEDGQTINIILSELLILKSQGR